MNFHPSDKGLAAREIMIASVLLAILAVLAVPYFTTQKKSTYRQISANNLKQWGIALNLFMIENDNQLPSIGDELPRADDHFAWYNALPLYLNMSSLAEESNQPAPGQSSLWIDPSAKNERKPSDGARYFTYGMNRWIQPDPAQLSYKIYDFADPSALVFLTEVNGFTPGALPDNTDVRHEDSKGQASVHVLFADGHVEIIPREELLDNPSVTDPKAPIENLTWIPFLNAPKPKIP